MPMEKTGFRSSSKKAAIFRFIPKLASSAVAFQQSLPIRDARPDASKGFSGPIVSLVPVEARRDPRKGSFDAAQEPRSPKISCLGKVKKCKKNRDDDAKIKNPSREVKKQVSIIRRMFKKSNEDEKVRTSSLAQMNRFSSGRDALANFDWTKAVVPVRVDCHSDEEKPDSEEEESEFRIPFSAPILVGGKAVAEPKKEVKLWKRRLMPPPPPLRLNDL